jgi:adhesin/invasin
MPQFSKSRWLLGALSGALLLGGAACDDNDFNAIVILGSAISVATGSDGQTGVVGQALPNPITVHVTDVNGNSAANSIVTWTVISGGGSVSAAASLTDANGNASVIWTMGPTVGTATLRAAISSGTFVDITATAQPGEITASIAKTSGDAQTIPAGTASDPMVITLTDLAGNAVAGATVTWTASPSGTLSATSTTTDAAGQTSVTLTPAAAGVYTVTVSAPGAAAVTFTITAT